MKILVFALHDNQSLNDATAKTVSAAQKLGEDITVLVAGADCRAAAEAAAQLAGVRRVWLAEDAHYAHRLAEPIADLVHSLADQFDAFLCPAATTGKNIVPRAAALLDVAPLSDVSDILDAETFVRPIYAGNALMTVKCREPKKLMSIRTTAFPAAAGGGNAPIEPVPAAAAKDISRFVKEELTQSDRPELTAASIIISGGRGMQAGENFKLLDKIADRLGAAVGASRAAVDAGFVPNDYQVGQTGKVVAPELYIAVGISGAIQHLAGMKDSKVIVAINKDEEAPIFQVADYGVVGDLFQLIPELDDALNKAGYTDKS